LVSPLTDGHARERAGGDESMIEKVSQNRDSNPMPRKKRLVSESDHIAVNLGPATICIQSTIARDLLGIQEEETVRSFAELYQAFSEVCDEHRIELDPIDLQILEANEIKRGISTKFRDTEDGSLFVEVLIPITDFKIHQYWKYTLLHELGHSWFSGELSTEDKELGYEDLFIDLIAICTFRKILPPKKWVYHEVRRHRPFFLTQQTKRFLGRELYREILQDPEGYLRDLREKIYTSQIPLDISELDE
jgi:hypothetical protein